MVATAVERKPIEPSGRRAALRRWFKLSGVAPVGVFLVLHLWTSASVLASREVYDAQLVAINGVPLLGVIEIVFVLLPLAFHALFGLHLAFRPDPGPHAYASDGLHFLQRVTGVVAFVFVVMHLWHLRAQAWLSGVEVQSYSTRLEAHLASMQGGVPWIALGYVVGLAACVFHLACGMTSFWHARGWSSTPEARRRVAIVFATLGGLFFATSFLVIVQLATGTRVFSPPEPPRRAPCGSAATAVLPSAAPRL